MKPFILAFALLLPAVGAQSTTVADSLYQAAIALPDTLDLNTRIRAFKQVLKADEKYASAYCELARLYMQYKNPVARQDADRAIHQAMRMDPDNLKYQLEFGSLLYEKGFKNASAEVFETVLAKHPDCAEAHYMMSRFQDEETHLKQCIASDPDYRDAYFKLALLYFDTNQPDSMVHTMLRLLKRNPDDKDVLLYCGLAYRSIGDWQKAGRLYAEAIKRMAPDERAAMEDVEDITIETERHVLQPKQDTDPQQTQIERERFWRKQDPLLLTTYNERLLEHYSRVAYANLRFSDPSHNIKGYETDPGKTYIRFGPPVTQSHSLGKRIWYYEGFQITFEVGFISRNLRFGGYFLEEVLAMLDQGMPPISAGHEVFHKEPQRFIDPYKQLKYRPPHQIVAFREGDHMRIELACALPKDRLNAWAGTVNLTDGLFLFTPDWDPVAKDVREISRLSPLGTDSLRSAYLLSQRTFNIQPGDYIFDTEILDRTTNAIGAIRSAQTFAIADTGLAVSDLLLAADITPRKRFPESRSDLDIVPNPLRTYSHSEPVFLYLEAYNLDRDTYGRTRFDIAYRVGLPDKTDIDPGLFIPLDARGDTVSITSLTDPDAAPNAIPQIRVQYRLPKHNQIREALRRMQDIPNRVETAVSAEYEGNRPDDFTFLEIDVRTLPEGIYKLAVTITDRHTGANINKDTLFRIIQ